MVAAVVASPTGARTVAAAAGYVAGLFPSADIVAKAVGRAENTARVDPRRTGSGNPGAANVASLLGKRAGAVVFGLDMTKAVVASQVGRSIGGERAANIAATAAVYGHCFPAHQNFRGGKGVAASFGQMLATFPAYLPVDIALGAVAAKSDFWKQRPVATIGATCGLWVGLAQLWARKDWPGLFGSGVSVPMAAATSSAAIVYRFWFEAKAGPPAESADRNIAAAINGSR